MSMLRSSDIHADELFRLDLDPDSPEPLYRQLRRQLESAIVSGMFRPERPLPSTRYLSAALGVSRNTVTIAYQELTAAGIIESRPRSGLYPVAGVAFGARPSVSAPLRVGAREAVLRPEPADRVDWSRRLRSRNAHLGHSRLRTDWHRYPYPLIPGQPEPGSFPARSWLRALNDAMSGPHLRYAIQDSVADDDPLLVDMIRCEILPPRGVIADDDEILVTNGAQQALALIADVLIRNGTRVAVENPGYRDAAQIFSRAGASLRPVPVDAEGAIVTAAPDHDIAYLTPSHHHPTNATLSLGRRRWLLERARATDALIIEDDYDSEVRFRGRPTASLKSLDHAGRVIYVGTFSKFVAPGLRMGFIVADRRLVSALRDHRRYSTKHPSGHVQRALALFIESGEYHRALRGHRNRLKLKWELLSEGLADALGFPVHPPAGGLSIWAEGPGDFDGTALTEAAERRGVLIDAGEHFHLTQAAPRNAVRIGFAAVPLDALPGALRALTAARRDLSTRH